MQTHSRQHDDSARRLQQELADLELRKRALQEQQEQTEQQWREQTEHHDRQLQERMVSAFPSFFTRRFVHQI